MKDDKKDHKTLNFKAWKEEGEKEGEGR